MGVLVLFQFSVLLQWNTLSPPLSPSSVEGFFLWGAGWTRYALTAILIGAYTCTYTCVCTCATKGGYSDAEQSFR